MSLTLDCYLSIYECLAFCGVDEVRISRITDRRFAFVLPGRHPIRLAVLAVAGGQEEGLVARPWPWVRQRQAHPPAKFPTKAPMQIIVGLDQPELKHSIQQRIMLLILFYTSKSRANKSHRLNAGSYLPRLVINLQESIVVTGTKCAATVRPHRLRMYPGHSYVDPTPPHIPIRLEATYLILKK
jgi:hypothetical protein